MTRQSFVGTAEKLAFCHGVCLCNPVVLELNACSDLKGTEIRAA